MYIQHVSSNIFIIWLQCIIDFCWFSSFSLSQFFLMKNGFETIEIKLFIHIHFVWLYFLIRISLSSRFQAFLCIYFCFYKKSGNNKQERKTFRLRDIQPWSQKFLHFLFKLIPPRSYKEQYKIRRRHTTFFGTRMNKWN